MRVCDILQCGYYKYLFLNMAGVLTNAVTNFYLRYLVAALLISSFFCPLYGFADSNRPKTSVEALADLSIEQLMSIEVSSTSFFDISPAKAPGSLYLIPREQMENSYASSISDFLQYYVPGVHISGEYSAGSLYSTRGIASPSNSTTLFMINGSNMSISSGTGINTNLNLPLMGDIERIEVLKGPCSIMHGSGSINGFINVIQKNGTDNPGGFINTEAGLTDGLVKAETGYGISLPDYGDIFLYAGGVKSDGISEVGTRSAIIQNGVQTDSSYSNVNDNYFPDINTRFFLNWNKSNCSLIAMIQNEKVESTLPRATYVQENSNIDDTGSTMVHNNNDMTMTSMAFVPQISFEFTDTETITVGLPVHYFEYNSSYFAPQSSDTDSEFQLKSNFVFKTTRFSNHRMALGFSASVKQFDSDNVSIYFESEGVEQADPVRAEADFEWIETSVSFEDNYQFTKDLVLFAGLRYDAIPSSSLILNTLDSFSFIDEAGKANYISAGNKIIDSEFSTLDILIPRVGITYDIDDDKIIKFIYQEGYHNPDYINAIKYLNSHKQPTLLAEEVNSYELGYSQEFMGDKCRFDLNLYSNVFENTVFFTLDNIQDEKRNTVITDNFISTGFETSFVFMPKQGTRLELSYAFSKPHSFEDDNDAINSLLVDESGDHWRAYPEHTIKINMNKTFMNEKLTLSLGGLFNKAISTANKAVPELTSSSSDLSGANDLFDHNRFVLNAAARYHLTENCSFIIRGENIFDNHVPATGYYYNLQNDNNISLEHPTYTIGFSWKF